MLSRWRCGRILLRVGSLALVLLLASPQSLTAGLRLSLDDLRLLRQGRILFKNDVPAGGVGGGALGGTALALLQSDPETVWRTLMDFPSHAGLFPQVKESRVIEHLADQTLVRYLVAVGPFTFRFFIKNYADPSVFVLRWELDHGRRNDLFRDHWGYWKVEPRSEGALVTYAMGGRTTLPAFLTRGAGQEGTVQTLRALKERVEHHPHL